MLVDVFQVQYANIEVTRPAWIAKTLLKTIVYGDLTPHQMFRLYHEFGITNITTWSDLSYDHVESILLAIKKIRRKLIL
jgi:hypothetical protein